MQVGILLRPVSGEVVDGVIMCGNIPKDQQQAVADLANRLAREHAAKDPKGSAEREQMGLATEDPGLTDLLVAQGFSLDQVRTIEASVAYWLRTWIGGFGRSQSYEGVLQSLAGDLDDVSRWST